MSHRTIIRAVADFSAPAADVWDLLLDWAAIVDWMPDGYVRSLECEGSGPGAVRHLVTGDGSRLSERLDRADAGSGLLELSLIGRIPWGLLSYTARGKLDSLSSDRCRLTWEGRPELPNDGPEFEKVVNLLRKSYLKMFQGIRNEVES